MTMLDNLEYIMDVRFYHHDRPTDIFNPCSFNNAGCSHLCLLSPSKEGFTCACPSGMTLNAEDGRNCNSKMERYD